jgi:hypothetical protein
LRWQAVLADTAVSEWLHTDWANAFCNPIQQQRFCFDQAADPIKKLQILAGLDSSATTG